MPWCPKCKNEYQDGIEFCADCNEPLVDELPEEDDRVAVAYISDEPLAEKLVKYLEYESIPADRYFDENEESWCVQVAPDKLLAAKSAFQAFYRVESKNIASECSDADEIPEASVSDELESINLEDLSDSEKELLSQALVSKEVYKPAEVYVTKSDVSKDMFSTAITFLVFALALVVFLILNALNIVTLFNNAASLIIMGVMAFVCCLVGINAIRRSRKAEIESYDENKLTAAIKEWLDTNVTDDLFSGLDTDGLSEEVLYLKRNEIIKEKLAQEYPDLNEDYVDALLDDFYDTRFPVSGEEE